MAPRISAWVSSIYKSITRDVDSSVIIYVIILTNITSQNINAYQALI